MPAPRLRAVVLAAGHGTRLRPLTSGRPKPLLPILGRPLLAETLERLAGAGVEATAINLHHLADAIPEALGDRFADMPLVYSREREILGTLGALHPLREFLAPADLVLLVNGDSLCRWPFAELIERHRSAEPLATLLLSETADVAAFGGGVAIDAAGGIVGFGRERGEPLVAAGSGGSGAGGQRSAVPRQPGAVGAGERAVAARRVFAGAHVFAPSLALEAPAAFSDIVRHLYRPRLEAGARLQSLTTGAPWHDLGTPARYLEAALDWAADAAAASAGPPARVWIHPAASIAAGAVLEDAVVEAGASLEAGVSGRSILVLDGARVGRSTRLERVVVAPGVEIPAGSSIADALVTPRRWGLAAGSREEDALVVTPLGAEGSRRVG